MGQYQWEDLPDAETIGYDTKRQEASDLRDEIIGIIKPRLDELAAAESVSELAGAKGISSAPATTVKVQIDELRAFHEQLKANRTKVTQNYLTDELFQTISPVMIVKKILKSELKNTTAFRNEINVN